jgi:predicted acetyltransferase
METNRLFGIFKMIPTKSDFKFSVVRSPNLLSDEQIHSMATLVTKHYTAKNFQDSIAFLEETVLHSQIELVHLDNELIGFSVSKDKIEHKDHIDSFCVEFFVQQSVDNHWVNVQLIENSCQRHQEIQFLKVNIQSFFNFLQFKAFFKDSLLCPVIGYKTLFDQVNGKSIGRTAFFEDIPKEYQNLLYLLEDQASPNPNGYIYKFYRDGGLYNSSPNDTVFPLDTKSGDVVTIIGRNPFHNQ